MADDEVGVEPERLAELASALETLRDVLARNVPVIVNTMEEYWNSGVGTPINLMPLKQAQAQSVQDAADMRARSNLAQAWMNQAVNIDMVSGGKAQIPWDTANIDSADAQLQAQQLAAAEKSGNRAQIQAIQTDIQDHIDDNDTGWLTAFYNQASPQVANLAQTLHDLGAGNPAEDYQNRFAVLTSADQQIIATYAHGLAIADKAGLSPQAIQAITTTPNIWSSAMLLKFGPPGSQWATSEPKTKQNPDGSSLLALLTQQVYEDEQNGTIKIPVGYGVSYSLEDRNQLADTLANYDPLQTMLQADAQNKNAAWQVMGGKDGNSIAQMLLNQVNNDLPGLDARFLQGQQNDKGQYPGYFTMYAPGKAVPSNHMGQILLNSPSQQVVGAFLDEATSARRGNNQNSYESAQAAMNIIMNTPSPNGDSGITEDPAVQEALLHTAQRYLLDLAESTQYDGSPDVLSFDNQTGNPYVLKIPGVQSGTTGDPAGTTPLSMFLQQVLSNPTNAGILTASTKTTLGRYYALGATKGFPPGGPSSPDMDMAALLGRIDTESGNITFSQAQVTDEQNAEINALIDFGKDAATWVPVVGDYADKATSLANLFGIPTDLPTGTANVQQLVNEHDFAVDETKINVPMVQALLDANAIPAADLKNQPWLQNGQVVLTNQNAAEFSTWWDSVNGRLHNLRQMEAQYQQQMQLQEQLTEDKSSGSGG